MVRHLRADPRWETLVSLFGIDHASNFPSITATNSCCTSLTGIAVKTEPKKPRITKRSASALQPTTHQVVHFFWIDPSHTGCVSGGYFVLIDQKDWVGIALGLVSRPDFLVARPPLLLLLNVSDTVKC